MSHADSGVSVGHDTCAREYSHILIGTIKDARLSLTIDASRFVNLRHPILIWFGRPVGRQTCRLRPSGERRLVE